MILTPQRAQQIKDKATQLFKDSHYSSYSAELQTTVCTLLALAALCPDIVIEAVERQAYESVDDL